MLAFGWACCVVGHVLIASGADPNVRNAKGWGAVHVAASGGSMDVVPWLVAGERACDAEIRHSV
jgi:ankyrin repeat protein